MNTSISEKASLPQRNEFWKLVFPWVLTALFLLFLPVIFTSNSALTIMNQMAITIIFALAYNMLLGQGGMLSFGHAVYMGVGGFMCVHVMNYVEVNSAPLSLPFLPIFGGLFGLGLATLVGTFSTRSAGTVFAMISLGVGELIAACSLIIVAFFGGEEGVSADRTYMRPFFEIEFFTQIEVYYLTSVWLLISALLMYLFSRTPIGRMANAVRDNPERAEFLGYSARWVRYYSFCASGFFCGIAGALFAINFEILTEENLNLATSGSILLVTFLGGVGVFFGPIIGAVLFTLLQTVLGLYTELWQLYLGALFLATVMFFPQGFAGVLVSHAPAARNGRLGSLFIPYVKMAAPSAVCLWSMAGLAELLFHARHAALGEEKMVYFGINMLSTSVIPWTVFGGLAVISFGICRKVAPSVLEAWDKAITPKGMAQ
jgi:branched-chain amino acid transport system permease protein